jgi:hypothetical protein
VTILQDLIVPIDDSPLDLLAALVRANPPLPTAEVSTLLAAARRASGASQAGADLSRHQLDLALDAALRLHAEKDDVTDLFQEASLAVVAAVAEYIAGSGDAAGLRDHVRSAVEAHIGAVHAEEARRREEQEAFVRDSRMLDMAEVALKHELGRPATTAELAEVLEWEPRRVELLGIMLDDARRLHDESLLPYLDDDEAV